jgi:hypothetical protein
VVAKLDNQKKKGWFWVGDRADSWVRASGYVSGIGGDCGTQIDFNSHMGWDYKPNAKAVKHKVFVPTKTSKNWVTGEFYGTGGIYYKKQLSWW